MVGRRGVGMTCCGCWEIADSDGWVLHDRIYSRGRRGKVRVRYNI